MRRFWLGLLALLLTGLRLATMIVAYVVVSIAEQLERAGEWCDVRRGIPIVQVGDDERAGIPQPKPKPEVEDDRAKTMDDILKDFSPAQRVAYENHVDAPLCAWVEVHGTDFVYWDIHEWVLK